MNKYIGERNFKYGDYHFKKYMEIISNLKLYFSVYEKYLLTPVLWNYFKSCYEDVNDWIERIELMQDLIINANVSRKYQKCFNNKCQKMTNEMAILVNVKIYLETLAFPNISIKPKQ